MRSLRLLAPRVMSAGLRSAGARTFMASARRMGAVAEPDFDFNTFSQEATSSEARAEIEAMRGVHRELMKKFKIEEAKANAPEIDWAYYAERVKSSDVAAEMKAAYAATPEFKVTTDSADIEKDFDVMIASAEEAGVKSQQAIKDLEASLLAIEADSDYANITVDSALEKDPELKAEIEAEIAKKEWYSGE
mmetsp:Transcript_21816/g.51810  ORF Transcript_21816/g.51810 Transcript_21816/m.51810 type:complete len:191 (-) Transcript_21816:136-708(-)